jgi:hypothetical protein
MRDTLIQGLEDGRWVGIAGYLDFADAFYFGDAVRAWRVARVLLEAADFADLDWQMQLPVRTEARHKYRQILMSSLEDGRLRGEAGYDLFADESFAGRSHTAWHVARAVLTDEEFALLGWPREKLTHRRDEGRYRKALLTGHREGHLIGELGYKRFATTFFQGDLLKAWQAARSVLDTPTFRELCWGMQRPYRLADEAAYLTLVRGALEDPRFQGPKGYETFSRAYFRRNGERSWRIAKVLLQDDFPRLRWGFKQRRFPREA